MGIHGLTTYLRESRTALATAISFPSQDGQRPAKSNIIVVDGWSFIFEVASWAGIPWVYGGEYAVFARLITQVVVAWKSVGLHVCFVFDGAYPILKFPTLVSRATETAIQVGQLFFRTSAAARSTPRFLRENSLLPPLTYTVCVQTLQELSSSSATRQEPPWLEVHFADEEGDPYAVALAARLNAYVVGRDSDFVVLNADGYQGYIPFDEMVWIAESASDAASIFSSVDGDDDIDSNGFKTVRKSKTRRRDAESAHVGRGIIPPESTSDDTVLSLVCNVFSPTSLADQLQIPVSLLPLLGALVGNDFTSASVDAVPSALARSRNSQYMFFERQLTLSQRITRVAGTLRSLLETASAGDSPAAHKRKRRQIGSVMELIDAAVNALLLRPPDTMGSGELEAIVERIVEATLPYAIRLDNGSLPSPNSCALHSLDACRLIDFFSRAEPSDVHVDVDDEEQQPSRSAADHRRVRALYLHAYRHGELSPRMIDVLSTGTAWPGRALEHPDKESVSRSVARPIRQWCYAVLDAGVKLPGSPEEDEDAGDSDDELVDVVEEDSDEDPLSPLRDALERLDNPDAAPPVSLPPPAPPRPKIVTEHVRRGTHLASEEVAVPSLSDLLDEFAVPAPPGSPLSIQLWPEDLRLTFFLRALGSDTPSIRALHCAQLSAVLAVRWVVMRMHARAEESPTQRDKQAERWMREEIQAFLSAFSWSSPAGASPSEGDGSSASGDPVPIEERNIQLVTQVSLASDAVEHFAQVLLLGRLAPSPMRHFSGLRFHAALTTHPGRMTLVGDDILGACLEGLESAMMAKPTKAKKKRRGAVGEAASPSASQGKTRGAMAAGNMYDVLAAMSA